MATSAAWRVRPLFLTSTFRDTHTERDWLRDRVFPELEERLRARRCHIEPIDLRWGVDTAAADEEGARQLTVLKVCLAEVERSRPFLIGILGDRYGWVPPPERMQAAAREAGFDRPVAGRSVTDLEIDFGALADPEQCRRSLFYLREPLPYDGMKPEVAARYREPPGSEPERKLEQLKQRLRHELPDRVRSYTVEWDAERERVSGLEAWGRQVLEDLWRELDPETHLAERAPSWQDEERFALEQLVERCARDFVGREGLLEELVALVTGPTTEGAPRGACLSGPAGSGKSAMFAQLLRRLQEQGDLLVLAHAAGASPRAGRADTILRRWVEELAEGLGEQDPLDADAPADEVEEALAALLYRASAQRRVVLLLDALDQLESTARARGLTWLPADWPANARLVATAIPGPASEALLSRSGLRDLALPPLEREEAARIATRLCARYHRQLNPEVLEVLLSKQRADGTSASGNPLWLRLAVEELNLLDADDFARLERAEFARGSDEERLRALLVAVAGDLPAELEDLYSERIERAEALHGTAWARAFAEALAVSRSGLREQDLRALLPPLTGEPWDALRFAALRRTFRADVVQRGAQGQWDFAHDQLRRAVHTHSLSDPAAERRIHAALAEYLLALPSEDPLHVSETMVHLLGAGDAARAARYWADATDAESAGAARAVADDVTIGGGFELGDFRCIEALTGAADSVELLDGLCQRLVFDLDAELARTGNLFIRCKLAEATHGLVRTAVERSPVGAALLPRLLSSHTRLGDLLIERGQLGAALTQYVAGRAIAEELAHDAPADPVWLEALATLLARIGMVRLEQGDPAAAFAAQEAGLEVREKLASSDPTNPRRRRDLAASLGHMGDMRVARGELESAAGTYARGLELRERLVSDDPDDRESRRGLAVLQAKLGDTWRMRGDLSAARALYESCQECLQRLADGDPQDRQGQLDLSVGHGRVGDALLAEEEFAGARVQYEAALAIAKRLAGGDELNIDQLRHLSVCHNKLGDVCYRLGELPHSRSSYAASASIVERLTARDPTNALWQRDLVASCYKLASVAKQEGREAEWLAALRRCWQVLSGMKRAGMAFDPQLAQLFGQLEQVMKST